MAPTIHLVRHAQGFHNLCVENENIHDPDLTVFGQEQCSLLRTTFPYTKVVNTLVASPLRRTIETCIRAFGEPERYPITCIDILQEVSRLPSDTGSDIASLREEFGDKVDLSRVRDNWTDKSGDSVFAPLFDKLVIRGREARRALRQIAQAAGDGDEHIAVISHGAFLHFLTDDWYGIEPGSATGWANCEYRSYQFVDQSGQDEDAALRETEESWRRRAGATVPPTIAEQQQLRSTMQKRMTPEVEVVA